ncbi:MAG: WhiB family transcriptional regulator [Actinomycetota bacterium]|nr:WhiB family transcriptional regulator [Actinomycetota bacterium]
MTAARSSIFDFIQPDVAGELAWQLRAACLGRGREVDFFPARGMSANPAKRVCFSCPVLAACLTDALERKDRWAVAGGCSEKDRRPLLARIAGGEPIEAVVASALPRVRLGWKPSSQMSADYGRFLLTRRMTREAAA